jgi:hypothetical protein
MSIVHQGGARGGCAGRKIDESAVAPIAGPWATSLSSEWIYSRCWVSVGFKHDCTGFVVDQYTIEKHSLDPCQDELKIYHIRAPMAQGPLSLLALRK